MREDPNRRALRYVRRNGPKPERPEVLQRTTEGELLLKAATDAQTGWKLVTFRRRPGPADSHARLGGDASSTSQAQAPSSADKK